MLTVLRAPPPVFPRRPARVDRNPAPPAFPSTVMDWNSLLAFVAKGGDVSARRLASWDIRRRKATPGWDGYRKGFEAFSHERLFRLEPRDFASALGATEHALGELRPGDERFDGIADWSPPVPFMYIFHRVMEELGRVPLWQDARDFLWSGRGEDLAWGPFRGRFGLGDGAPDPDDPHVKGFTFRVGKNYYSWFREAHLLTELRRTHGVDARYHFLIDAEWKADIVAGDVLVELFVRHPDYKDRGAEGRKELCKDANPWATVRQAPITRRKVFGKPWLVDPAEIATMASMMRAAGAPLLFQPPN